MSDSIQSAIAELEDGLSYLQSRYNYSPVYKEEPMRILSNFFQLVFRLEPPRHGRRGSECLGEGQRALVQRGQQQREP